MPLDRALRLVQDQSNIRLVFAERVVNGRTASCRYVGDDAEAALRCVLRGSGLAATAIRDDQFVIVSDTNAAARATLRGRVLDARSREVLPGAHIYIPSIDAGAVTNRDGYFALSGLPPGRYPVRISYLGYGAVDTTLTTGAPNQVLLQTTTIAADSIVVEGSATANPEQAYVPGVMTLSMNQLDELPTLGEPDLFKALQWMPSIHKSNILSGGLSVRGASPDQNLYLLDGAPVYHPWHAFSLISTFQTGTLKTSNFYRGAFPPEHGGRLASVLDAQMKDGNARTPHASAALSVLSARFQVEGPLSEDVTFMVSGRRSYVDKLIGRRHPVVDPATGRRDTLRTGYYFYDTSAKLSARLNARHRMSLTFYRGRDDLDLRLPFDLSFDFSSWLRPADLFFEVRQNWDNTVTSLQHDWLVSDRLFLSSTGYFSGYRAQEQAFIQPTTTASLASNYTVALRDVGAKFDVDYYHSVAHRLRAGLHVSRFAFSSTLDSRLQRSVSDVETQRDVSRLDAVELTTYVQDVWQPSGPLTVQTGVRASFFSDVAHVQVQPRLSAQYVLHPTWLTLRAAAGRHVQYLHRLRDRFSLAYDVVSSRWIPSDAGVAPATAWQFSAGARSYPLPMLTAELNLYARLTDNMLIPEDVFQSKDNLQGPGINVGTLLGQYVPAKARAFGAELSLLAERGPWQLRVSGSLGRSLVQTPEQNNGRWRPADLDVPVGFNGVLGWSDGPWSATLAVDARRGFPLSRPVARYAVGTPLQEAPTTYLYRPRINNGRLPTYWRVDATAGYRFSMLSARWKARLTLYNVTNHANVVGRQYEPTPTGVLRDDQRGLPILPLFELEMTL
ncbi:TonB-dependent receptor domain-containing protein [Salisaeta longa]|uniref:TonB-dependent receptor domain-containing protein n=1 Tax=Salisaeta longa TaxID=503170 RepID=UPI001E2B5473|nr:TonB-dependent receptor [Salisaeta longa]